MKKNKLVYSIIALLTLTGCGPSDYKGGNHADGEGDDNPPSTHHYGPWQSNETRHFKTCTDEGCDEVVSEFHDFDEWEYDSYATTTGNGFWSQTTPGRRHRTCDTCDYVQSEEHNFTEDNVHECVFSDAYEKDETNHWLKCTLTINGQPCDRKDHEEAHQFGDWVIDNYAEIIHDAAGADDVVVTIGNKHRDCSVCAYKETATHREEAPLAEHAHTYDTTWMSNEQSHWHQCNFGKTIGYGGREMYACPDKKDEAAHSWNAGEVTKQPTTSSEGIKTFTCSVCNATKTESIAPLVDNTDGSEAISVNFKQLTGKQAATVNPKTKAYIDAMKAAEKNLADPMKMQELNNGVNVENYLSKDEFKDSAGQGHNKPDGITLSWEKGNMDYTNAVIKYSPKADMSDALEVSTSGTSVKVNNLLSNTKYYYQLTYTKGTTLYKSNIATFETADYTRFIDMGLVYNVRDMGNYKTSYGGRVRQGLVYRGSELTPKAYSDGNGSHPKNIDAEVLQLQKDVLKIRVEIDHRSAGEAQNLTTSPITSTEIPVEYRREGYKVSAYTNFLNAGNTEIQNIYKAFAEADTKPVYYHCIGGADRTGCVGFVLLGLLGVSYTDAIIDFEVTTATNYPRSRFFNHPEAPYYSQFPNFYNAFVGSSWYNSSKSFKDNCEAFLKSKGVTAATIEKIRTVMIEGYGNSTGGGSSSGGSTTGGGTGSGSAETTHTEKTHVWSTETKVQTAGKVDVYTSTCSCGKKKVSFLAKDGTLASGSTNNNNAGYLKLKTNGNSISYNINLPEAINGKVYFFGYMDSWPDNGSKSYYSGNSTNTTHADTVGNFKLEFDNNAVDFSAMKSKTFGDMFSGSGSNSEEGYAEIGAVNLTAGAHTVKFTRVDSYNITTKSFAIIY